ncbi:zinc finger protein 432 isoform X2 [Bombina bombina]|nr:zinc finger protein 432 isoform X2 [Bombina bombina]
MKELNEGNRNISSTILNHALEMIYLLTGEEYTVAKKDSPHSTLHPLTGEVPIKCDDVAVYFSMEEWEYIEGHKELYKDVIMEKHQTLGSRENNRSDLHDQYVIEEIQFTEDEKDVEEMGIFSKNSAGDINSELLIADEADDLCVRYMEAQNQEINHNINTTDGQIRVSMSQELYTAADSSEGLLDDSTSILEEGNSNVNSPVNSTLLEREMIKYTSSLYEYEKNVQHRNERFISNSRTCRTEMEETDNNTQTFNNAASCDDHQALHKGGKLNKNSNQFIFKSLPQMSPHRTATRSKLYTCPDCEKRFTKMSQLIRHHRTHSGEKPYVCQKCGKGFSQKSNLVGHQRTHTGEKPYVCPICEKAFSQKSDMIVHQRTHTGEKPYVCPKCGKGFAQSANRDKHYRTHTGEKPYICLKCGKGFSQGGNLVKHHKLHTGEKPYLCPVCGKDFTKKSSLLLHEKMHTGEKGYICSQCGETFPTKSDLNNHHRTHMTEENKCLPGGKRFT